MSPENKGCYWVFTVCQIPCTDRGGNQRDNKRSPSMEEPSADAPTAPWVLPPRVPGKLFPSRFLHILFLWFSPVSEQCHKDHRWLLLFSPFLPVYQDRQCNTTTQQNASLVFNQPHYICMAKGFQEWETKIYGACRIRSGLVRISYVLAE